MDLKKPLFSALALVALAGGTAIAAAPADAGPRPNVSALYVAPVAIITQTQARPMIVGGREVMRYSLSGTSSYDPDGTIVSYYWSSSCTYVPDGYSSTYTVDVRAGDTCQVNLYVTDNSSAIGNDSDSLQGP